jgi:DNA-binding response OmpR family regulator
MRLPQVLVYESDRRLAELLRRSNKPPRFALREPRSLEGCLRLLRRGGPSVLVLKVGTELTREFAILERVTWQFPDTAVIVVGDTENAPLASLAWDLGARLILFPPLPRHELPELVDYFLNASRPTAVPQPGPSAEPLVEVEE